jgi:AcrR family transcriptional regulator
VNDYVGGKAWKQEKYDRILEEGFRLFSERGIEQATLQEVSEACEIGRTTTFRYFPSKTELAVAISTWKWKEYIEWHNNLLSAEEMEKITGAEYLKFYIGSFLDLYRNHKDMLRFNYNFNSFLSYQKGTAEQKQPYQKMVNVLAEQFHGLYERGRQDGTLNTDVPEHQMFSSIFHIMLAAITRYATGLAIVNESDPDGELVRLANMMIKEFTKPNSVKLL